MRIQQRWNMFTRRYPKVLAFLQGLWMVLEALIGAIAGFFVGFGHVYGDNYRKNRFGVVTASVFLLLVLGVLLWHPWSKHTPAAKPGTTVQEPREPQGLGKFLPQPAPKLSFSEAEKKALVAKYGANALNGLLLVVSPGHGGRDAGTRFGLDVGCSWMFDGEAFYECAYTYRISKEVGLMAEALGAKVVFTATAASMDEVTGPRDPLPLPKDAVLYGGDPLNNSNDTVARARAATQIKDDYAGKYSQIVFIEVHIDAMGSPGWSGMRVCYPRGDKSRFASLVEDAVVANGYGRKHFGKGKPADSGLSKTFDCINGNWNGIQNRILLECGVPNDDKDIVAMANDHRWGGISFKDQRRFLGSDTWRARNPENRRLMIDRCFIGPCADLMKGGGQ